MTFERLTIVVQIELRELFPIRIKFSSTKNWRRKKVNCMKNYDILDDILTANMKVEFSNSPNLLSLAETLYVLITYTCSIHILSVHVNIVFIP